MSIYTKICQEMNRVPIVNVCLQKKNHGKSHVFVRIYYRFSFFFSKSSSAQNRFLNAMIYCCEFYIAAQFRDLTQT